MIKTFLRDEEGVTLVEYGLLVGLISVVAIAAITEVGESVDALFQAVADELSDAVNIANDTG